MSGLFNSAKRPLAEEMRPKSMDEVVGQSHLLSKGGFLRKTMDAGVPTSIILWGPAGCGKTTLAKLYARHFGAEFEEVSAVFSGVADIKKIVAESKTRHDVGQLTVLFVDEIHRFNKAQQDAFLPFVENGTIVLVGATTENPSFALNSALLSRAHVLTLQSLSDADLEKLLARVESENGTLPITADARAAVISFANGDGRYLLGLVESIMISGDADNVLEVADLKKFLNKKSATYDKSGDAHYDTISTLHKAIRGSDVNGALYWFSRMCVAGEDVNYIARRLVRMASEEIGMADPTALQHAVSASQAYQMLGSPEGELALAETIVHMCLAPKSNAVYMAWKASVRDAKEHSGFGPPMFSRNAPTKLMKQMGYNEGYLYDHDQPDAFAGQNYFPEEMERQKYYSPNPRGYERDMMKRDSYYEKLREEKSASRKSKK